MAKNWPLFLMNNNKCTYQYLCDTSKSMVRGNFIALNGYIRKQGGFEIRYLRFNVRSPVKYDQIKTISS